MLTLPFKVILFIIFVCAKEILVFNEEILIVIAFSLFLYLVLQYGSSMIATELDDKAKIIQNKFDIYKNIEEKTMIHLINYHKKREFLSEKIKLLSNIKKSRINIIQQYYKAILLKQVLLQTEETLNRLIFNEFSTLFILQEKFIIKLNSLNLKLNEK